MSDRRSGEETNLSGFYEAVHLITVYGTLLFLGLMSIYLVGRASDGGPYPAIRSLAGALFPLVIASFVYIFNKELLEKLGAVHTTLAFLVATAAGVGVMVALRYLASASPIPLAELVLSACFSTLVFSSRSLPDKQALSYYYGVISGMLVYIILFGFPLLE